MSGVRHSDTHVEYELDPDDTMAMNVGPATATKTSSISTINTTPLVDVMLVLLIIFLITMPVVTHVDPGRAAEGAQRDPRDEAGEHRASRSIAHGAHLLERPADADARTRWSSG